jgi:hypothetical protein
MSPEVLSEVGAALHAEGGSGRGYLAVIASVQERAITDVLQGAQAPADALYQLRTAHVRFPDLAPRSVYVRENKSSAGTLRAGDVAPDVPLFRTDGEQVGSSTVRGDVAVDLEVPRWDVPLFRTDGEQVGSSTVRGDVAVDLEVPVRLMYCWLLHRTGDSLFSHPL